MNDPIAELDQLIFEMRTTNVTRGLKVNVHERWIATLSRLASDFRRDRGFAEARIAELETQAAAAKSIKDAAKAVVGRQR